jgi:hypothetical protein
LRMGGGGGGSIGIRGVLGCVGWSDFVCAVCAIVISICGINESGDGGIYELLDDATHFSIFTFLTLNRPGCIVMLRCSSL